MFGELVSHAFGTDKTDNYCNENEDTKRRYHQPWTPLVCDGNGPFVQMKATNLPCYINSILYPIIDSPDFLNFSTLPLRDIFIVSSSLPFVQQPENSIYYGQ